MTLTRMTCAALLVALTLTPFARADDAPQYTRAQKVVYGEKHGTALTMDILEPKENANGRGIILIVSGGWYSAHASIDGFIPQEFLKRGYKVFAVNHGSMPKYTIPEILEDLNHAVRFVRFHAAAMKVDPMKLGVYGASAGGHLSLMIGTAGKDGDPNAKDPVDTRSSRVQAVACFFPPTDFLNYGEAGASGIGEGLLAPFAAAFDFSEFSEKTRRFERITDTEKRRALGAEISPINHVTSDDPPTLIVHGTKDRIVPFQQAQVMIAKLKEAKVPNKLIVKEGADHGWPNWQQDLIEITDWFDEHLK